MGADYYDMVIPLEDDPTKNLVNLVLNGCALSCLKIDSNSNAEECKLFNIPVGGKEALAHKSWLEDMLMKYSKEKSTAWLAVTIHHPFSLEPALKKHILPLLQKYNVDLLITGHKHQSAYSVIGRTQKILHPEVDFLDTILLDCKKSTKEYFKESSAEHFVKKGDLHELMVGSSGTELKKICPVYATEFNIMMESVEKHSFMIIEVSSTKVHVTF